MIAQVVPILRLRRDTTWWSYQVPASLTCLPGSLVRISFRGHDCLGIVWHLEEKDDKAEQPILQVLTRKPLLRSPQRSLIEWLSQQGLCSLSTSLYVWLPKGLRGPTLSRLARTLLSTHDERAEQTSLPRQHAVIVPSFRPQQSRQLASRLHERFRELFATGEAEQLENWFAIASGNVSVGLGREGALFAPWANLSQLTVVEPEDIAYYHEQIPYLNLVEAAQQLAKISNLTPDIRTAIPQVASQELWKGDVQGTESSKIRPTLVDLRKEPLLNPELVSAIQTTLAEGKQVLALYNAHDHASLITRDGRKEKVVQPGIETVSRRLAHMLGQESLPRSIIIGTRNIFSSPHPRVGLTVVLSLDPLLAHSSFANQLHGIADLGHLSKYEVPCIIQTHNPGHPLVQSLLNGSLETYILQEIAHQREATLPPFGQQIVCSLPDSEEAAIMAASTHEALLGLLEAPWEASHPFAAPWRKKPYRHILLHTPDSQTRVPIQLRRHLASLPRPWKIQRDPWYLL